MQWAEFICSHEWRKLNGCPSLNRKLHASALQLNGTMPYAGLVVPRVVYETA